MYFILLLLFFLLKLPSALGDVLTSPALRGCGGMCGNLSSVFSVRCSSKKKVTKLQKVKKSGAKSGREESVSLCVACSNMADRAELLAGC